MSATAPLAHAVVELAADPGRVYDAWIQPLLITEWMFAPGDLVQRARNEPLVGGHFSFCVKRGDQVLDHVGTYLELERPKRLVFTWGVGRIEDARAQVTVSIRGREPGRSVCGIDHVLMPEHAAMVDTCARSWSRMLERLASRCARGLDDLPHR